MRLSVLAIAMALSAALPTLAQTDTAFTYQGELKEAGQPAQGSFLMSFTLWDAVSGGSQVGDPVVVGGLPVIGGLFSVQLDFGADVFNNQGRWLQITVEGTTLSPRQPITRSPYSIQTRGIFVSEAGNVGIGTTNPQRQLDLEAPESVFRLFSTDGSPSTLSRLQFKTANAPGIFTPLGVIEFIDQSDTRLAFIQGTKAGGGQALVSVNVVPGGVAQLTVKGSSVDAGTDLRVLRPSDQMASASIGSAGADSFFQAHGGNVGVGTLAPTAKLHAVDTAPSGVARGVSGVAASTIGTGVAGHATATTGSNFGVAGQSDSPAGTGVLGYTLATSGLNYAVWGWNNSTNGRGVYGWAANPLGVNHGVYGLSGSTLGTGVLGEAGANAGNATGVHGKTNSFSGAGVRAEGAGATGTALDIRSGAIRVTGAGLGASTPVFIHMATVANSNNCDGTGCFCYSTRIDHPLCNGDPSAILFVTVNDNVGAAQPGEHRVRYDAGEGRWHIQAPFGGVNGWFCVGQKYNVLVIKQ